MTDHHRRGLILDFGGVLTTSVPACARSFSLREGLHGDAFLNAMAVDPVGRDLYADLERGAITQEEWNTGTAALLGVDSTDLLRRVLTDLHPEPSVLAAAQAARRAGIRVGILSNSLGMEPFDPYEPYRFDELYDTVLISEHYKLRKPDPEIYAIMLDLMQMPAEELVFVDDTPRNLPPAEELGIATVLATDPADTIAQVERLLGLRLAAEV